jgi:hypothetical protein
MVFFDKNRLMEIAKTSPYLKNRTRALKGLIEQGAHPEIAEVAMFGNHADVRRAAVNYFSKAERWDFANWLRRIALDSNFPSTQLYAVNVLGDFASRKRSGVIRAVFALRSILSRGNEEIVEHTKWQLGRIGRHGPLEARMQAIDLLGKSSDARSLARIVERGEFSESRKLALEKLFGLEKQVVSEHLQRAITRSKHADTAREIFNWFLRNQDYAGQAKAGMYSKIKEIRLAAVDELKRSGRTRELVHVATRGNFRDASARALRAAVRMGGVQALRAIEKRPSTKLPASELEALREKAAMFPRFRQRQLPLRFKRR